MQSRRRQTLCRTSRRTARWNRTSTGPSGAQPDVVGPAPGGLVEAEACTRAVVYCACLEPRPPPELSSGWGPTHEPSRPAQRPMKPTTNRTQYCCLKQVVLPMNFWRSVWLKRVVGDEKENRPPSHWVHRDYPLNSIEFLYSKSK
jgi:hypothetical protein